MSTCGEVNLYMAILICAVFVGGITIYFLSFYLRHKKVFQEERLKRNGRMGRYMFFYPRLIFQVENFEISVVLTMPAKTNPPYTIVSSNS